jgi:transcription elongation factor Elf1
MYTPREGRVKTPATFRDILPVLRRMPNKFKCPNCGSGSTKPLPMAIASGTRRRKTIGVSRRSIWGSASTYRSDLVAGLPERPSNTTAYVLMLLGSCGLLFAVFVGNDAKGSQGFAFIIGTLGLLCLLGGYGLKKPMERLRTAQEVWDHGWLCSRCGHRWLPS